jgi:hypothetical protein
LGFISLGQEDLDALVIGQALALRKNNVLSFLPSDMEFSFRFQGLLTAVRPWVRLGDAGDGALGFDALDLGQRDQATAGYDNGLDAPLSDGPANAFNMPTPAVGELSRREKTGAVGTVGIVFNGWPAGCRLCCLDAHHHDALRLQRNLMQRCPAACWRNQLPSACWPKKGVNGNDSPRRAMR